MAHECSSATIKADEACEFLVLAKKDFRAVKEFMQRQIQQKLDDMRSFKVCPICCLIRGDPLFADERSFRLL